MPQLRTLALVAFVAAAAAGSARADEVVLKNGRTIVGKVAEETTKSVRIEMATGSMTVARDDVVDIRRGPVPERKKEPLQPKPAGPRITGGGKPDPAATAAAKGIPMPPAARSSSGPDLEKLMAELDRITLATWPEDVAEPARPEDAGKPWRIQRQDGVHELLDAAPPDASPKRVWKLVRNGDGERQFLLNGVVQQVWQPMYFDTVRREWTTIHPALADFQRDCAISKRIVACVADKDVNAWVECNVQKEAIAKRQAGKVRDTSVNVVPERERLLSAAVRCAGSEPAGKDVARILEIEIDLDWASPAEKIRLAVERREILRRLVSPQPR